MTTSLDSEAKVRLTAHLPVMSQKSVNFEPSGYSLTRGTGGMPGWPPIAADQDPLEPQSSARHAAPRQFRRNKI